MYICISDVFLSILVAYVEEIKRSGKEMVKIGHSSPFYGHSLSFCGTCHWQSQLIRTASTWFSVGSMSYHTGLKKGCEFHYCLNFRRLKFQSKFWRYPLKCHHDLWSVIKVWQASRELDCRRCIDERYGHGHVVGPVYACSRRLCYSALLHAPCWGQGDFIQLAVINRLD